MADYDSALPIRTEADGTDERVHVKVVDGTTPAQRMSVTTDGEAKVQAQGDNPTGGVKVLRLSELGAPNPDGVYHATNNTDPGNVGLVAHTRAATPADTDQTKRVTAVTNSTRHCLDTAMHDEEGVPFSFSNPLPVTDVGDTEGDEKHDYNTGSSIAADAVSNHDYTVTAGKTLKLRQVLASASGKMKVRVQVETGVGTGVFNDVVVRFNATANPQADTDFIVARSVGAGVKVRVARTNLDNQAQDLYSTIIGVEV